MRAILVCVDYQDILSVTLPYNRHQFDQVCIVTDGKSYDGVRRVVDSLDYDQNYIYTTEEFYARGAVFNKWLALENALDWYGRHGWLCVMDADVLWPKSAEIEQGGYLYGHQTSLHLSGPLMTRGCGMQIGVGQLCTPLRRMFTDVTLPLPPESEWSKYPIHQNVTEWAGYSQIFHADDPVLGSPPWHEVDWTHAGSADSVFQNKWPRERKVRPPFEVLHIGISGVNWCGRASPRLDGSIPEEAGERREMVKQIWAGRRKGGKGRFDHEKLR